MWKNTWWAAYSQQSCPGWPEARSLKPHTKQPTLRLHTYASFVRFSHSVFALPFALTGALLALNRTGAWQAGTVGWRVIWIVVAMVGARSAAMGFNRLVDARYDALNTRTAGRGRRHG